MVRLHRRLPLQQRQQRQLLLLQQLRHCCWTYPSRIRQRVSSSKASNMLLQVTLQQVGTVQSRSTPALLLQKQVTSPLCLLVLLQLLVAHRRLQTQQLQLQQ
jgi:hypothetical protein